MNDFSAKSFVAQLFLTLCILMIVGMVNIPSALAGATLDNVRSIGVVHCRVTEDLTSFSFKNKTGHWEGDLVGTPMAEIAVAGAEAAGVVPVNSEEVASAVFVGAGASVVKEWVPIS